MKKVIVKRKKLRIVFVLLVLFVCFVFLQRYLIIKNKSKQFAITSENGIETLEFIEIGGIQQALLIRGNDVSNPFILDLHGGPGYPNMATGSYKPEWEDYFTIVYFDQRLAGKTYYANNVNAVKQSDSMDIRIQDVIDVAEYISERFNKEKIVLHGSSWGTVLGINAILQRPDLFCAYIGNSQVVNQYEADMLVYDETLRLSQESGNQRQIDSLLDMQGRFPSNTYDEHYYDNLSAMRTIARNYVGEMSLTSNGLMTNIWPQFYSPYYTLKEATYFLRYTNLISEVAPKYMIENYDMRSLGLVYDVPVFFISGRLDYSTPVALLEDLFQEMKAPQKEIYIIEDHGHGIGYRQYTELMLRTIYPIAVENS